METIQNKIQVLIPSNYIWYTNAEIKPANDNSDDWLMIGNEDSIELNMGSAIVAD